MRPGPTARFVSRSIANSAASDRKLSVPKERDWHPFGKSQLSEHDRECAAKLLYENATWHKNAAPRPRRGALTAVSGPDAAAREGF
jgi:hypothetical protein